ncbi:gliding motility lipoprotein GldH [Ferruginibacter sp.]
MKWTFSFLTGCTLMIVLSLTSCTQLAVFEKDTSIPQYQWKSSFEVKGSFDVTDSAAAYDSYLVLRHTDAYKYNNIWLDLAIQPPGDTMHHQKIDMPLGTDANGWLGTGMNDIWELRQLHFKGAHFKKPGRYNFIITQIMRDDPLPGIMSAGFRLEKQ